MTPEKKRRVSHALGFVSGVLACLDAIRDKKTAWPPAELWSELRSMQRIELAAGIALILITIVLSIVRKSSD